jgi:colicin import membrane protein
MSTISKSRVPVPAHPQPDPFRYGWREVRVEGPDGTVSFDQVPLTLEDVLFPETGDFIVQTDPHDSDLNYLKDVFKARLADEPSTAVVSDCRVDWNLPGVRPLGPDIAVFAGVKRYRPWATLDVAKEGVRPLLVVEVTSPDTRKNDVEIKLDYYYRAGVPLYIIADVLEEDELERRLELIAYQHTPAGYERIGADWRGWIWLEPVRLWLGVTRESRAGYQRLACYDPETGEEIGDYTAVSQALADESAARAHAEARAAAAQAQAAVAQAQAAAAQARAQAELDARVQAEARARAEGEARAQAEARIQALEAELNRRSGRDS